MLDDGHKYLSETKHVEVNKLINLVVLKSRQFDDTFFTIMHNVCWFGRCYDTVCRLLRGTLCSK
jgi:hypothetical protein